MVILLSEPERAQTTTVRVSPPLAACRCSRTRLWPRAARPPQLACPLGYTCCRVRIAALHLAAVVHLVSAGVAPPYRLHLWERGRFSTLRFVVRGAASRVAVCWSWALLVIGVQIVSAALRSSAHRRREPSDGQTPRGTRPSGTDPGTWRTGASDDAALSVLAGSERLCRLSLNALGCPFLTIVTTLNTVSLGWQ
jgi:hypothetical protein